MLPSHAPPKGIHDNEVLYLYSTTLLCRSDEREDDDDQVKNKNKTLPPKPLQRSSSVSLCGSCLVTLGAQWLYAVVIRCYLCKWTVIMLSYT